MPTRWPGRDRVALAAAVVAPLVVCLLLVPVRTHFTNTDAALVLVAVVVAVAANGDRLAGYVAAVSSAVWFDFFLTRPYERLSITRSADVETTLLLLVIGAAVTELAVWGRRQYAEASRRSGYVTGIYAAAEAAGTDLSADRVIDQVTGQLTRLLDLRACSFQPGVAGVGAPGRLHHDGRVVVDGRPWPVDERGLPAGDLELLIESGGYLRGRFLMGPAARAHPSLESRLVSVALADQVGAALAGHR